MKISEIVRISGNSSINNSNKKFHHPIICGNYAEYLYSQVVLHYLFFHAHQLIMKDTVYEHIVNSPHLFVVRRDITGRFTYINPAFAKKFAFLSQDLIGETFDLTTHPRDIEKLNNALSRCITHPEEKLTLKIRKNKENYDFWWIQWEISAIKDENDNVVEILFIGHDITESETNSLRVLDYAKKANTILNGITDGFYTVNHLWEITRVNKVFEKTLGMKSGEIIGKNLWDIFPKNEQYAYQIAFRKTMNEKQTSRFDALFNGKWLSITAYSSLEGITVFLQDITEQKKQEEEIRENIEQMLRVQNKLIVSEKEVSAIAKRYESVLEGCMDAVITSNHLGDIEFFNKAAEKLWGYTKGEMLGKNVRLLMPSDHARNHDTYMSNYSQTQQAQIIGKGRELEIVTKAGEKVPIHLTITEAKAGEMPVFTAFVKNISKEVEIRKQKEQGEKEVQRQLEMTKAAEEELRQSVEELGDAQKVLQKSLYEESKLSLIVRNTNDMVVLTDIHGKITWINEAFTKVTGYSLAEIIGEKPGHILQGEETDAHTVASISQDLEAYKEIKTEIINYTKSGEKYWIEVKIQPILDNEGKPVGFMAIQSVITERKEYEQKILHRNKLLEEIAFVQAHEVRRPVANILGLINLIRGEEDPYTKIIATYINYLDVAAKDLDDVIHQIVFKTNEAD